MFQMIKEWLLVGTEFGFAAFAAVLIFVALSLLVLAVVGAFAVIAKGVSEEDEGGE